MNESSPLRAGDVWDASLDPIQGHEQGGFRPVIIVSANWYNEIPHGLCMVVPLSRQHKGVQAHVPISQEDAGLRSLSFALCEQVRAISVTRLRRKRGSVSKEMLTQLRAIVHGFLDE